MFITSSEYEKVISSILEEENLLVAVAFWGRGAERILHRCSGRQVKLICNLASGATNPSVIDTLRNQKGVFLRQHDKLHAKVIIGNKRAVVGSANFSNNGLNLEGSELSGWQEAGLLTNDSLQIEAIRAWFNTLWDESRKIEDIDLTEAQLKWERRREVRPLPLSSREFSLKTFNRSDILDRRIFVVISRSCISDDARKAYQMYKKKLTGQQINGAKLPPIYENWPELPKGAQLLDLYFGPRKALQCYGVFMRTHDLKFNYNDGSKGYLAICRKDNHVMGYSFGTNESSNFAKDLRPHIEKIWGSKLAFGDESGKYIHFADVIDICS